MVSTIGLERTASKYEARVKVAVDDYRKGVSESKKSWANNTLAAKDAYVAGVQSGDIGDRFAKGVNDAGDSKQKSMALNKGAGRFASGVSAGLPYYKSGMGEVLSVIEGITLPPRAPAGDPSNQQRSALVGETLHSWKVGRS